MDRTRRPHKWAAVATWMRTGNRCVTARNRRNAVANQDISEMLTISCVYQRKLRFEQNDRRRENRKRIEENGKVKINFLNFQYKTIDNQLIKQKICMCVLF